MTLTTERPPVAEPALDPLLAAIAAAQPEPAIAPDGEVKSRDLVLIWYSGDLEKTWASLILATTAAASGVNTKVFITFWGLQAFVKDDVRITGETWMQKMMSVMQRPGISHRKLSKMNFLGMGPWMMGVLAKKYGVAKPKELLEAAEALGVEFMPCQMTMDMFGLKREDMIDGLGEPVGAATVIELLNNGAASLFI
ncbi:MAG TPA: DsrE/DsrF/DrsH-like family protein [Candidatus Limnocylindrales bacterium]|nr:DsrE/DsrF/DrsH-like family protein [Candidatus Limnocylindrales bacterium]